MASIGDLNLRIIANPRRFLSGIDKAIKGVSNFTNRVTKAFGKIFRPVRAGADLIKDLFAEVLSDDSEFGRIEQLGRVADATGFTLDRLVALEQAGNKLGIQFEDTSESLLDFSQNLGEAALEAEENRKEMAKASGALDSFAFTEQAKAAAGLEASFQRLGLDVRKLNKLSRDEAFTRFLDRLQDVDRAGERLAIAGPILGEDNARKITRLLGLTAEQIREAQKEAERFGLTISEIDVRNVVRARAAVARLETAFSGIRRQLAVALAPTVERLALKLTDLVEEIGARDIGKALTQGLVNAVTVVVKLVDFFIKLAPAIKRVVAEVGKLAESLNDVLENVEKLDPFGKETKTAVEKAQESISLNVPGAPRATRAINVKKVAAAFKEVGDEIDRLPDGLRKTDALIADIARKNVAAVVADPRIVLKGGTRRALTKSLEDLKGVFERAGQVAFDVDLSDTIKGLEKLKLTVDRNLNEPLGDGEVLAGRLKTRFAEITANLRQELAGLRFTPEQLQFRELRRLGAAPAQIAAVQGLRQQIDALRERKTLEEEAARVKDKLKGPQDRLNERVLKLNKLWKANLLDVFQFTDAVKDARRELLNLPSERLLPPALQAGTPEAVSFLNRTASGLNNQQGFFGQLLATLREALAAEERAERHERDQLEAQRKTERAIRELASALLGAG